MKDKKNNMYDYVVTLKDNHQKVFRVISFLLLLIAMLNLTFFFLLSYVADGWTNARVLLMISLVIIFTITVISLFKKGTLPMRYAFFLVGINFYLYAPLSYLKYILSILYILIGFFEKQFLKEKELLFNKEGLLISSFYNTTYTWLELATVVIRDNIITVNFKNNRYLQQDISGEVSVEEERDFNIYCQQHLTTD